jgi:hypothetical protein
MRTPLEKELARLDKSAIDLARALRIKGKNPVMEPWRWITGLRVPGYKNAARIQKAIRSLGGEISLEQLMAGRKA